MKRAVTLATLVALSALGACQKRPVPGGDAPAAPASVGPDAGFLIASVCKDGTTVYKLTDGNKLAVWTDGHWEAFDPSLTAVAYCAGHKK